MCEANSPSSRTSKTWTGEIHNEPILRENKFLCKQKHIFRRQFHKTFLTSRAKRFKRKILLHFCLIRRLLLRLLRVIEAEACRSFTLWIWKRFVKTVTVTSININAALSLSLVCICIWPVYYFFKFICTFSQSCSNAVSADTRPWVHHTV